MKSVSQKVVNWIVWLIKYRRPPRTSNLVDADNFESWEEELIGRHIHRTDEQTESTQREKRNS